MTQEELEALCGYWQKVLRLQDWEISIRFVRVHEMDDTFHRGNIDMHADSKNAFIKVIEEDDYTRDPVSRPYDAEATVVHELLHLHLLPLAGTEYNANEEVAVNLIASALLSLNRK